MFAISWKTVAKSLIGAIVVFGLALAAHNAIEQWGQESAKLDAQIDSINLQLSQSNQPRQRQALQASKSRLEQSRPRLANLRWRRIGVAALVYAMALVPPAFLLRDALVGLGQRPRIGTSIAAQLLGHAGKYVPGKAMVIVLRVGVMSGDEVGPLATTIAVFTETFIVMAVGAAVAGLVVLWLPVPLWITATALTFAVAASLPTWPPILKRIAARVSKVELAELDSRIGSGLVARGWCLALLSWLLFGVSFALVIAAIPSLTPLPPRAELYATATAAFSLAMVVGFASLVPGGAGVRELVITTVLGASIGTAHGLFAAIAMRLLSIVVEAMLALGSWLWLRYNAAQEDCKE